MSDLRRIPVDQLDIADIARQRCEDTDAGLDESLRRHGQLLPIVVVPGPTPGRWLVLDGNRRVASARRLGISHLHADARPLVGQGAAYFAVINGQRRNLSPQDRVRLSKELLGMDLAPVRVAEIIGVDPAEITYARRLASLPDGDPVAAAFFAGEISFAAAKALVRAEPETRRSELLRWWREGDHTTRELEQRVAMRPSQPTRIVPGSGVAIMGWEGEADSFDATRVPNLDPSWRLRADIAMPLALGLGQGMNTLLVGHAGSGKTFAVEQLAAVAAAPLLKITCSHDTRVTDLLGHQSLRSGETYFEIGSVLSAWTRGWWLLLDEISALGPGVLHALHGLLNGDTTFALEDGRVLSRGAGFRMFATSNVAGLAGEHRSRYAGNQAVSPALLSRFPIKVSVPRFEAEEVAALLRRWTPIESRPGSRALEDSCARWFIELQEAAEADGPLRHIVSLRELRGFWSAVHAPLAVDGARCWPAILDIARWTVANAMPSAEQADTVVELLASRVGDA